MYKTTTQTAPNVNAQRGIRRKKPRNPTPHDLRRVGIRRLDAVLLLRVGFLSVICLYKVNPSAREYQGKKEE